MLVASRPIRPFGSVQPPSARRILAVTCSSNSSKGSKQQCVNRRAVLSQLAAAAGLLSGLQGALPGLASAQATPAQVVAEGFIDWWKSRRAANGGAKLLAPLYVAQQRLQQAGQLLEGEALNGDQVLQALQLVRASSLNCYIFEALPDDSFETKTSLFTQEYNLSDPCTFRIVLKNVTDLEPASTQEEAKQKMDALVLSYQKLDEYLDMAREAGNSDAVGKARDQLKTTQLIAADIESFVKATLGV